MWNKEYKKDNFFWGLKVPKILESYLSKIPKGKALDLGCGEGKFSIFLSKNNFEVDAIDKEEAGIEKLKKFIKQNKITNINPQVKDILDFNFKPNNYNLIIASQVLDFLKLSEIEKIIDKIKTSTKKGGYIFISVFSTKEPSYKKIKEILKRKEIERNTFYLPKKNIFRHFFTVNELKNFFEDWEIKYTKQEQIEDSHGDVGKHFHNKITFIAKK